MVALIRKRDATIGSIFSKHELQYSIPLQGNNWTEESTDLAIIIKIQIWMSGLQIPSSKKNSFQCQWGSK